MKRPGPLLNLPLADVKSGDIVTAKLASSNSDD